MIETDDGAKFEYKIFSHFLNKKNIKNSSHYTTLRAVFAEGFDRTLRDLFKRPVFEKGESNWKDVLPMITKRFNYRNRSSTKVTSS